MATLLFVVDMQNDFCTPQGTLFVPGADKDVQRLVSFINNHQSQINGIILTQDSHQVIDISHPYFWTNKEGNHPAPFTSISANDIREQRWIPAYQKHDALAYIQKLEAQGEYAHIIWPEHCLIGSRGAAIHESLMGAIIQWAHKGQWYQLFQKGTNPFTEHFGALHANIPIDAAPETQVNQALLSELVRFENIILAGEARSHCVANTIKQLLVYPSIMSKITLLDDCTSNVPTFEHIADDIYQHAINMGMQITTSTAITL